jgi:hypothetical protein
LEGRLHPRRHQNRNPGPNPGGFTAIDDFGKSRRIIRRATPRKGASAPNACAVSGRSLSSLDEPSIGVDCTAVGHPDDVDATNFEVANGNDGATAIVAVRDKIETRTPTVPSSVHKCQPAILLSHLRLVISSNLLDGAAVALHRL